MKIMILERFAYSPMGTFGDVFTIDDDNNTRAIGVRRWYSIERQWLNNQSNISCIPEGEYVCRLINHPRRGKVWEVMDVPNRTEIYIHVMNTQLDSLGCIGLGKTIGGIYPPQDPTKLWWAVQQSKKAIKEFHDYMGTDTEFRLIIRQYKPMEA